MTDDTTKRPLILWSGGFDSTCLVIDKLHKGDIDIMYVSLENNKIMQKREQLAITKLKCLIADANLKGSIVTEHKFGYDTLRLTKTVFAQPALWLQAATYIANPEYHSEVNIAYVKGDDIWHYKTEIATVYAALLALTCNGDEIVPLKFPYEWHTKEGIGDTLKDFEYSKQVMKLIYYCEGGGKEPCGNCTSCKRHAAELGAETKFIAVDMTAEFNKWKANEPKKQEKEYERN